MLTRRFQLLIESLGQADFHLEVLVESGVASLLSVSLGDLLHCVR